MGPLQENSKSLGLVRFGQLNLLIRSSPFDSRFLRYCYISASERGISQAVGDAALFVGLHLQGCLDEVMTVGVVEHNSMDVCMFVI